MKRKYLGLALAGVLAVGGLAGCVQTPAAKSAELSAVETGLDTLASYLGTFAKQTPPPTWYADVEAADTAADQSLTAAENAYNQGASDAAALAAAAESQLGNVIALLVKAGVPVPASASANLSTAQTMHAKAQAMGQLRYPIASLTTH